MNSSGIVYEVSLLCCRYQLSLPVHHCPLLQPSQPLTGRDVPESVSSPERTLGLRRFLYTVYLIDRVEMTPHSSTSPATTDRVKEFLQSVGITVFLRGDT
jgi:hypothetical protein